MKVQDFTEFVTKLEGKKKSLSIAQVKEVVKIVNKLLGGSVYKEIRNTNKTQIEYNIKK